MAFQTTAPGLNFWRFMAGLGIGVELVTIGACISELLPSQIRGRAFACEQPVGFLSVPIVAFLSYLLVPHKPFGLDSWRQVVILGAHDALFVWFIRRALPEKSTLARPEGPACGGRRADVQIGGDRPKSTEARFSSRGIEVAVSRTEKKGDSRAPAATPKIVSSRKPYKPL